ncbi:MAG: response regulator [Lachnospiraceae bacterium]|nr:response regulator [Lachnospiraceae bacterium]
MELKINQKILVVDDKGMNRFMLGVMFHDGYEILEARNGLEAIEILEQERDELAVILLDVIMPVMDGFGVLEHMKKDNELQKIPVVIVTDDSSEETSVKAFEYDVADMVIKPFEPRIIKRRVQNIIELYAYRNEERRNEL